MINESSLKEVPISTEGALPKTDVELKQNEKDAIGNFVLKLYHERFLTNDGLVRKNTVRAEFNKYVNQNGYVLTFENMNIGSLLQKCNFLFNTPRGSEEFCLAMRRIFEFRNQKIKELDELRKNENKLVDLDSTVAEKDKLLEVIEISPDAEELAVVYQGGCEQKIVPGFTLTSLGCYICQENFKIQSDFEEHVSSHGFDSDFEFLTNLENEMDNIFEVIYRLCHKSHFFHFTMKTLKKDIVIEKIIIVQTRVMNYMKNNVVPYEIPSDGIDSFTVDSHLFTMGVEQPIVLVYRHKSDKTKRYIEQHHFLNTQKPKTKAIPKPQVQHSHAEINKPTYINSHAEINKPTYIHSGLKTCLERIAHLIDESYEDVFRQLDEIRLDLSLQRSDEFPKVHFRTRGYRLPSYKHMKNESILADYYPSPKIKNAQKEQFSNASLCAVSENIRQYIQEDKILNRTNIGDVLNTLLQIEDLEGMREYVPLHQTATKIKRFGREYSIKFKKLPKHIVLENIVTPMDQIKLTPLNQPIDVYTNKKMKKHFIGMVERVYYNQICFKYDGAIIDENKLYEIEIRPSRLLLRYQFRALSLLTPNSSYLEYLMPTNCNDEKYSIPTLDLELFNPSVESNPEQLQAVRNIAAGPSAFAPYVIVGPPGTGKTSTIVEAVLQLWKRRPDTRILITAGSNAACDEVAIRLCRVFVDLAPGEPNIVRIFAKSNEKRIDSIDDILIEASNFYSGHFYPDVAILREYRIIVCTLGVVGKLVTANIGREFFTHIFMDECCASTEPEILVGWIGTSSKKCRLIVSGDPKQLGPILKSKRAGELGLNVSFMERLLSQECYAVQGNGEYNRTIQTRLVRNFRSHPDLVYLYNRLYYGCELKAMAKTKDTSVNLNWHLLPNKTYPIIFHSVYGKSAKVGLSLSLCNEEEVKVVMDYVKDLMFFGIKGQPIQETDIGIISPYKKQYLRIQEELNLRGWHQIEVGAVETFQGKEKSIIIVSTVRSFTKSLGFLESPRRLNVILSRPKTLLIMIGNPRTLSQNKDFKYIIDECLRNNSTVGRFRGYVKEPSTVEFKENSFDVFAMTEMKQFLPLSRYQCADSIKSSSLKSKQSKGNKKRFTHRRTKNKSTTDDKANQNVKDIVIPGFDELSDVSNKNSLRFTYIKNSRIFNNLEDKEKLHNSKLLGNTMVTQISGNRENSMVTDKLLYEQDKLRDFKSRGANLPTITSFRFYNQESRKLPDKLLNEQDKLQDSTRLGENLARVKPHRIEIRQENLMVPDKSRELRKLGENLLSSQAQRSEHVVPPRSVHQNMQSSYMSVEPLYNRPQSNLLQSRWAEYEREPISDINNIPEVKKTQSKPKNKGCELS